MFKALFTWLGLSLCTLAYLGTTNNPALAQVTSDETVNTQVNDDGNTAEIIGGETRGDNLFHSFKYFSVKTGNEAFFNNANSISNIFSRVTGGNVSDIDGAIRANGSANLFLINPAGIIFGENASLNIGGSFYGSSASSILFEDGEFSATDLDKPPLLTVNAPIGLGFRDQPGDIVNRSTTDTVGLQVLPGQTIDLIGGDVNFEGGVVSAPGGVIELGGLAEAGTIGISEQGDLIFPDDVLRSDISLNENSSVAVGSSGDAGEIKINTGSLTANNESNLLAPGDIENNRQGNRGKVTIDAAEDVSFANGSAIFVQGGEVTLNARGNILFDGIASSSSGIANRIGETASGDIKDINIQAQNLTITNGAAIQSQVSGIADSGDINIDVAGSIKVDGFGNSSREVVTASGISSTIGSTGTGNAGKININTQNLEISRNGFISSRNAGQGNGGDISINTEKMNMGKQGNANRSPSFISTGIFRGAKGNGGNITINTGSLLISDGTEVNANVTGQGNSGNIKIKARDMVSVDGTGLFRGLDSPSAVTAEADAFNSSGDAGNIEIETSKLSITNNAQISSSILGGESSQGNGGDISIRALDSVNISEAGRILSLVAGENSTGNGGNINIETGRLTVAESIEKEKIFIEDNSTITTAILGYSTTGDAGDITIRTSDSVNVFGTGNITTDVSNAGNTASNGGNINIETDRLTVEGGAYISLSSSTNGNAGSLTISSRSIELKGFTENNRAGIRANAIVGNGNAGDINIVTNDLTIADGATITAGNIAASEEFSGTGRPGNINIQANSIRLKTGGSIEAVTQSTIGEGANINLKVAEDITLQDDSFISAQAFEDANGGNLKIDSEFIVAFPDGNNDIIANAEQGNGGNIAINAESLFGIEERPLNDSTNDINASSDFNLDGTISINTSRIDPLQGATELPANVVEAKQTTEQTCSADSGGKSNNGLAIAGRGGVSPIPEAPLSSETISKINPTQASIPQPLETSQGKIQPARGIKVTKSGKIVLTAYRTNNAGERIPEPKINCGQI